MTRESINLITLKLSKESEIEGHIICTQHSLHHHMSLMPIGILRMAIWTLSRPISPKHCVETPTESRKHLWNCWIPKIPCLRGKKGTDTILLSWYWCPKIGKWYQNLASNTRIIRKSVQTAEAFGILLPFRQRILPLIRNYDKCLKTYNGIDPIPVVSEFLRADNHALLGMDIFDREVLTANTSFNRLARSY